jgi:hypothetical protein
MAVIGEEIEGYVQNQINARQTLHGSGVGHTSNLRTDKQINLLNSNTSWIKLASGVSISGSNRLTELGLPTNLIGMGLAKNNILFSGTSKLINGQLEQREGFLPRDTNSSYTYGSFGFSPMPGIHSADIKTLTRGSLKKATVKLTANNKQQFDIIDLLYMRLGYTVLLEWGNSIYTTNGENKQTLGNTLIEDKFFESSGNDSYFTFLDDIEDKRDKHDGNYDALLGKVSNFNWSFNSDGSYSIELTIISLGDVIESLKSNLSVDKVTNKFLKLIIPQSTSTEDSVVDIIDGGASNSSTNGIAGDLYTWVKGNYSTAPDFPNGYAVSVLKKTVKLDLIPAQKSPRSILSEGWQTNKKTGKKVWVTKYNVTYLTEAQTNQFYTDVLKQLGAKPTSGNLVFIYAWRQAEGAKATYNPWNTTQGLGGSTNYNTIPVQNYLTYNDGITSSVKTLNNGKYPNIIKAFQKGIPDQKQAQLLAALLQTKSSWSPQKVTTLINSW